MKLLEDYRALHAEGKFPGMSLLQWVPDIAELIGEFKSRTILDYGCGLGHQYKRERAHVAWGVEMPTLYDPSVAGRDVLPVGKFDGVISTDVAEHIPEDEIDGYARTIAGYARKWAFISVCCRPSKHIRLLDGSNVHVTIRPFAWWKETLSAHFGDSTRLVLRETK